MKNLRHIARINDLEHKADQFKQILIAQNVVLIILAAAVIYLIFSGR